MKLEQKVVLITGAGGGIGVAAVRRFVAEGAKVMLADMDTEVTQALADELGADRCAAMAVDVTQEQQVKAMVDACVATFGRIDVFVGAPAALPSARQRQVQRKARRGSHGSSGAQVQRLSLVQGSGA